MPLVIPAESQINEADFKIIASKIERYFGFQFESGKNKDLTRILKSVFNSSKSKSWSAFIKNLTENDFDNELISTFIRFITIGETYFFRENSVLEILFDKVIPDMIKKGKTNLNIWSVSCSTGEEPYTLAIMLNEKYPELFNNAVIYGTDINSEFLQKARKGIYRNWSFRNTPKSIQEKYFNKTGSGYFELSAHIKNKVTFKLINLAHSLKAIIDIQQDFDIILFRNTMIYFSTAVNNKIVNRLVDLLTEGGCFIAGLAETTLVNCKLLKPLLLNKTRIFVKDSNYHQLSVPAPTAINLKSKRKTIRKPFKKPDIANNQNIQIERKQLSPAKKKENTNSNNTLTLKEMQQLFKLGEYDTLIEKFDAVKNDTQIKNYANDLLNEMNLLYCKAYANKGAVNQAIEICEQFLQRNKLDSNLHKLTAQLYTEAGNYNFALRHLNTSIFIDAESPMLFFFRATVNLKLNKSVEGKKDLEQASRLLNAHSPTEMLEEADGLTVGRLQDITNALLTNMKN